MTKAMPRTRKDASTRRKQVLDEAAKLIGERGYFGFGIQELAERCSLTKAGLLHHFGSKDALLIALLDERDKQHEHEAATLLANIPLAGKDIPTQRQLFVDALTHIVMRNAAQPELMRLQVIMRGETINASHPAHPYFGAREAAKLELIRNSVASFMHDPQAVARQLLALLGGLEEQWLREDCGFDIVRQARLGIEALIREPSR